MEMLDEFEIMRDVTLIRIVVVKQRIDLLNDDDRLVNSTLYQIMLTPRKFAAVETDRMITKRVKEPTKTEWAAPVV